MNKNIFKQHVEQNVFVYFSITTFAFMFILIFNKIYEKKINHIQLFSYHTKKKVAIADNKLSFIVLIDSFESTEDKLLKFGNLFKLSRELQAPIYFLVKGSDSKKLKDFFEVNDINEDFYLTNRLVFWEYSKGREPTLLVFKYNRLIHSDGVLDFNLKEKINSLRDIIKDR